MNEGIKMLVSVVIPVYNRERTIERAIRSVLNQTFTDFELLVVDDCSVDSTPKIVQSITDKRVRYHRLQERGGAATARNEGVALAKGSFIAFHDSDDTWKPDKLQKQLDLIHESNADICLCRLKRHGYPKGASDIVPEQTIAPGEVSYQDVLAGGIVAMPAVVARRSSLIQEPFDSALGWCEDYEWSIRAAKDNHIWLHDEVLGDVFLQDDSVTVKNTSQRIDFCNFMLHQYADICESHPEFHASLLNKLGNALTLNGVRTHDYYLKAYKSCGDTKLLIKHWLNRCGIFRGILLKKYGPTM